jgi:hypothetical protein
LEVQRNLNKLRYWKSAADSDALDAQQRLGDEAVRFLEGVQPPGITGLLQLDIVTNAAELWAFPFEACFAHHADWLETTDSGVVLTRRVRGGFSETTTSWPVVPSVLLLHAPVAKDLDQAFIDQHVSALVEALEPWARSKKVVESELLRVREITSVDDVRHHCGEFKPAYVHIVAHGASYVEDPFLPEKTAWGLRLGPPGQPGAPPREIAEALGSDQPSLRVVTFAACDSADQGVPIYSARSIVQELHLLGVPVVIGSQLPLTKPGSQVMTRIFYKRLLQGDDVRVALHAVRVALKACVDAGHDWLSLVGYVRLPPEGYAAYLEEIGLRVQLGLLDAAQVQADALNLEGGDSTAFADVERRVRDALQSLNGRRVSLIVRKDLADECWGLEASSYKRLSELLFLRGLHHPENKESDWSQSRDALKQALRAYREAHESDLHNHWLGMQELSLELVLTGQISHPEDWSIVVRAAELARDVAKQARNDEYWPYGTLCELALIASRVQGSRDLEPAKTTAALLVASARKANKTFPIESTRRQINRYVQWWTNEHGFFPGGDDLSSDARELLTVFE